MVDGKVVEDEARMQELAAKEVSEGRVGAGGDE